MIDDKDDAEVAPENGGEAGAAGMGRPTEEAASLKEAGLEPLEQEGLMKPAEHRRDDLVSPVPALTVRASLGAVENSDNRTVGGTTGPETDAAWEIAKRPANIATEVKPENPQPGNSPEPIAVSLAGQSSPGSKPEPIEGEAPLAAERSNSLHLEVSRSVGAVTGEDWVGSDFPRAVPEMPLPIKKEAVSSWAQPNAMRSEPPPALPNALPQLRELHATIGHYTAQNEQMFASMLQTLRAAVENQAEQQAEVSALAAQLQMVRAQIANMAFNRQ